MTTIKQFQARHDEPPTSDEMLAYQRGEMTAEEEARFRDRLIEYPDLVRTLVAEFPEPAEPGEADYLSDDEFAKHWAAMQSRMPRRGAAVYFWPSMTSIAATLALVFGALFWSYAAERRQPNISIFEDDYLVAGPSRGTGDDAKTVPLRDGQYVFVPVIGDQRPFESYRIEIRDANVSPPRSLWSRAGFQRTAKSTVIVTVPRTFLTPGRRYELALYGTLGPREEPLGIYDVRVATKER